LKDFDMILQQGYAPKIQQNLCWVFGLRASKPCAGSGCQHNYFHECNSKASRN
jgi:hypothetical protein